MDTPPRPVLRRVLRVLGALIVLLVLVLIAGSFWLRSQFRASLPQEEGERRVAGLTAPVTVERDALGTPTIRANSREDAARALGFLHAQERFFQMDLMRRQAAGELAELFGIEALQVDERHRVHRFRDVARRVVERASPAERALLQAYADGVNAGLAAIDAAGSRPFEDVALRIRPAPWKPEDTVLTSLAMFMELNDLDGVYESRLGVMHDTLPPALFAFLAPVGTEWDAPLTGGPLATPPIPGPEVFDLRRESRVAATDNHGQSRTLTDCDAGSWESVLVRVGPCSSVEMLGSIGSNNWAVSGAHTADGRAWLANDMHLGLAIPNTWYRASIVRPDGRGGTLRVTGVTLPGTPSIVVGSNGHVAWGFTNSYGDWSDLIVLETDPRRPDFYRAPAGWLPFEDHVETIRALGEDDVQLEVRSTIWGPVIDHDHLGRPRALAWIAHDPEAVNFGLDDLQNARTLEEAMAVANRSGAPPQNFAVADDTGRIGWTILGRIPRRVGFDGRFPVSWADGSRRWDGWLPPEQAPRIVDPPSGRIWTANARTLDGAGLATLGDGGYDLGARARQIRDDLLALGRATPRDLLGIQLDDRALFLERWRRLLLASLTPAATAGHPQRAEMRRLAESGWTGRASVDSAGYRLVRAFRRTLIDQVFATLTARCRQADPDFAGWTPRQAEGPVWKLLAERPAHLLDPRFRSWDEQILAAVDAALASLPEPGGRLADRTWGERNLVRIQHPLSQALPFVGRWLDVPPRPLPGDDNMPRFQSPAAGASERLVVSPGQEEKGFFHMPVGESGHPFSPHYRDGERAWEEGRPTPFLPGPPVHRLRLIPAA